MPIPKIKTGPKLVLVVACAFLLFTSLKYAASHGILPSSIGKILTPAKANLPDVKDAEIPNVKPVAYPSSSCQPSSSILIRGEFWEWSAQNALILATGGNCTTRGSLMAKYGVNLSLERQDDNSQMGKDLLACAKEIHDGQQQCSTGANFIVVMGDSGAQWAAELNPELLKLGPDYGIKIIGSVGYSRGEDAFMAPPTLKENPQSISETLMQDGNGNTIQQRGLLVEGVIRDGDWNIAEKWAGDNNILNNPDETTFDPTAINWVSTTDYTVAAKDYVAGKCEDRKEVAKGKLTGKILHVCVNGVVTWTPGDVIVAKKRGGLVKVVSSREYRSQMPAVILGPGMFFATHHKQFENLLRASFDAADQMKAFPAAGQKAAEIAAKVYKDEGDEGDSHGGYWAKYFKGVNYTDSQGNRVSLGGSAVNNLEDNKILFGLNPGTNDNMRSTYTIFRQIDLQQYPNLFKEGGATPLPDFKQVVDKSYLTGVIMSASNDEEPGAQADVVNYAKVGGSDVVSRRSYSINFATGSSQPLPDGERTLSDLKDSLAITGLKVRIDGYTDNTGSAQINTELSQARADEVKKWLQQHARSNFPDNRFATVEGHGPENPVADNSTSAGKAANRRVSITLLD
jgi:OmpA-OmpF porin, OOP family